MVAQILEQLKAKNAWNQKQFREFHKIALIILVRVLFLCLQLQVVQLEALQLVAREKDWEQRAKEHSLDHVTEHMDHGQWRLPAHAAIDAALQDVLGGQLGFYDF